VDHHLTAGLPLDRVIHKQVMGLCTHRLTGDIEATSRTWRTTYRCQTCGQSGFDYDSDYVGREVGVEPYSTDLTAAGRVIDHLMALGYRYVMQGNWHGDGQYWVGFDDQDGAGPYPPYQSGPCASIPLAICLAALDVLRCRLLSDREMNREAST
jgi:hypothetical protein